MAGTGMALGMSRIPDMTRAGRDEKLAVFKDTVPPGVPLLDHARGARAGRC